MRQILAESLVLAACGGLLGLALAVWGVSVLVRLAPEGLPRLDEIAVMDALPRFAIVVTAAVGLGFGLWPAWRASRAPLNAAIQGNVRSTAGQRAAGGRSCSWYRASWRSHRCCWCRRSAGRQLRAPESLNPGFDPRDLVAVDVSLPGAKYRDAAARIRFHEDVLERLSATPGVRSVAMAMQAPMRPADYAWRLDRRTAGAASGRVQPHGVPHRE